MDNRAWFKQAGYGMMVHFGLYTLLGGEYHGRRTPYYAEWAQSYFGIGTKEYSALATCFNPVYFNADEWIRLARDCGMQYFVITAKHHEGFALFKSHCDPFNVVDATPFGRDIIGELAEACYKYGLKLGLYYSQELDWHDPDGGGYTNSTPCAGISWHNSWDWKDRERNFTNCFENKIKPQVKEILTQYGDLCLIWFDTPHTITPAQSQELFALVKEYQPDCLINSRLGNGAYDYVSLGDNEIPQTAPTAMEQGSVDPNALGGFKYSPYGLYETAGTLNDSWGYKYYDQNWKSPETVAAYRKRLNSYGVNYLLNAGPDALGRIPSFSEEILRKAAELYDRENG